MQAIPELASSKLAEIPLCSAATHAGKIKVPSNETKLGHLVKAPRHWFQEKKRKSHKMLLPFPPSLFQDESRSFPQMCFCALAQREENQLDSTDKHASVEDAVLP